MGAFFSQLEIGAKRNECEVAAMKLSITEINASHDIVLYISYSCPYCMTAISALISANKDLFIVKASRTQRSVSV
jgi:hypothetical protein